MKDEGQRTKDEGDDDPQPLVPRTRRFASRAVRLCQALPKSPEATNIRSQLGRAATSVAANYRAAQRSRSKRAFCAKLGVVREDADECVYWLGLVIESGLLREDLVKSLRDEADQLTALFTASLESAGQRQGESPNTLESKSKNQLNTISSLVPRPSSFSPPFRIGHGFDLHRLEPGHTLVVGGQTLDHDRGCDAHSDGDVVYHAVTDAILGALGQDDIGQLFPDNDPQWKAADSRVFVEAAVARMHDAGYAVGNLDVTVVLQRPKLSPHKTAMRQNLADLLDADLADINLKGKTHENVDALGENRAIACHCVLLLIADATLDAPSDPAISDAADPDPTSPF
jgi:2-C-methyl-D-erythritol 2,4-cyclodiphosphate synthase